MSEEKSDTPKCSACGGVGRFYGFRYGLPIGFGFEDAPARLHTVILVTCHECGAVLGAYRDDEPREATR
jgi:hypothetical protein